MSTVVKFFCAECGYGPFDVDTNQEAPIPYSAIPVSVHDDQGEGQSLVFCPNCESPLPDFDQPYSKPAHQRGVQAA